MVDMAIFLIIISMPLKLRLQLVVYARQIYWCKGYKSDKMTSEVPMLIRYGTVDGLYHHDQAGTWGSTMTNRYL